jgi:transposase
VRVTTLLRRLIGVVELHVEGVELVGQDLLVHVKPRWRRPRCACCGARGAGYDRRNPRRWRHLGLGSIRIWLCYAPRRVNCASCGIHTEQVPWAVAQSRFTEAFEEMAAYLAQSSNQTHVCKLLGIAWVTVGAIVARVVERRLDPDRLEGLRWIGVDEFGYRRRARFLTLVADHERHRIVWASKGRDSNAFRAFFEELGPERCALLEGATADFAAYYLQPIREYAPQAEVVVDRFHVQRLASRALDEVRRVQLRTLRGSPAGKDLFHSRFVLLKNPWDLRPAERRKLSEIERSNKPLFRAYLLKESLAQALDYKQPWRAERALRDWLAWASRSRLKPFQRAARTIRRHFQGILAYVRTRLTNGLAEGLNNHARVIARRAFGFHSAEALTSFLYLCCGGIELHPNLPGPTPS